MLLDAVALDASMPAAEVLARLARYGLWRDPAQAPALEWIAARAALYGVAFAEAERRLRRDHARHGVAIRRQIGVNILWYAAEAAEVLERCSAADPAMPLIDVLNLHESDSVPALDALPMPPGFKF